MTSYRRSNRSRGEKAASSGWGRFRDVLLALVILASPTVTSLLTTITPVVWAASATGNSTQVSAGPSSVNLDLTTAAVVAFILMLLGLAAGILLLGRLLNPRARTGGVNNGL